MVFIKPFTNGDLVHVRMLWEKKALTTPWLFRPISYELLDEQVFGNVLFDRQGFLLAFEGDRPVGMIHASFLPDNDWSGPSNIHGIIVAPIVAPDAEDPETIEKELIIAAENYLKEKGIKVWCAGGCEKLSPFYTGLYGNGIPYGFFENDQKTIDLFEKMGYHFHMKFKRFSLDSQEYCPPTTIRIRESRQRFEVFMNKPSLTRNWWEANVYRNFQTFEWNAFLKDHSSLDPIGGALLHQMYTAGRNVQCILSDIGVSEAYLRLGLGSILLTTLIHDIANMLYSAVHINIAVFERDERFISFLKRHGFKPINGQISLYKTSEN
ncbi:MAG: GNAT family N-acetyltransferase [Planctomycetia bacterium]|nr:GNAT family N-acetyltransferase [Planctomycetia bacterium]